MLGGGGAWRGGVGWGRGSAGCVKTEGKTHTHTHAQNHAHNTNTKNSFSYVLYCTHLLKRTFSPLFNPKLVPPPPPPLPPLLPRVDSGLLSSFSYNWLMSSDQLQTTKPSPPTDGKVLRTALKCVEVRLCVCVLSCGPIKGSSV